jgi:hypothetical protein
MQDADLQRFGAAMTGMFVAHGKKPSKDELNVFWDFLKDELSISQFEHAARIVATSQKYPPTVPSVRMAAGVHIENRAESAWGTALQAVQQFGAYGAVQFEDAGTSDAIQNIGGWGRICGMTWDEMPFVRKEFISAYNPREWAGEPRVHESGETESPRQRFVSAPYLYATDSPRLGAGDD